MYHDMNIYEYLWYVDTWKLCKLRQVINSSVICWDSKVIDVEVIWNMFMYANKCCCLMLRQVPNYWLNDNMFNYKMHWNGKCSNESILVLMKEW